MSAATTPAESRESRELLTMREVADLLGVHYITVSKMIKDGRLRPVDHRPFLRHQYGLHFARADLEQMMSGAQASA